MLRGPLSTLFGKSASAGAIVVTTRAPSEQSEAALESTVTNDEEYRLSGSASGPLGESFGYRMSGYWTDREGYIDNLYNDHELNGTENHGLRGKLRWDASESIDATLTAYYNKDDDTCCVLTARELSPDALLFGALRLNRIGSDAGLHNDRVRMDIDFEGQTETAGGNLRVTSAPRTHLVSITAINGWSRLRDRRGWLGHRHRRAGRRWPRGDVPGLGDGQRFLFPGIPPALPGRREAGVPRGSVLRRFRIRALP